MNHPWVLLLINYLLITIEAFAITYLANGFFHRKSTSCLYSFSFLGLLVFCIVAVHLFETLPLFRAAITIIFYTIWILINFETSLAKSAIAAILLMSFQWILDSLFMASAIAITLNSGNSILEDPFSYYTVGYAAKLIAIFFFVLIRQWAKKKFQNQITQGLDWLRVSIIPFAVVLIALYLNYLLSIAPVFSTGIFVCVFLLLILDVMSILLLGHLERQQQELFDNAILQQNLKLEADHIAAIEEAYATQRKQTHDFNNQLSVLKSLADQQASQAEFSEYLGNILAIDFSATSHINTQRRVADIILNQRMAAAQSKSISLDLHLDNLSVFPLPDDALVVVLTNLIDNAIEACERIDSPEARRIVLKLKIKQTSAFLYIENTTSEPVKIRNNKIATTKENPRAHGYGLKNVCTMLEHNHATYAISYQPPNIFSFSAKIPIE